MDEGKSALTDLLPTSVSEPAAAMDTSEDKPASDVAATSAGDGDDTAMPKADGKKRKKPAEDDGDEGSDSDDEDRPAPLLDQDLALPTGSRRQRKAPQRLETGFHITAEFKTSDIAAGKGKKLGDIPNILFHTKDVPSGEARLCLLHRVLYGRDGKVPCVVRLLQWPSSESTSPLAHLPPPRWQACGASPRARRQSNTHFSRRDGWCQSCG
eukprot:m.36990 g.36990  ORF g.36990 m.36990 type:complete len:211 (-) comp11067_c1_seq2:49-681(-)